jgi:hypothetical protein
MPNKKKKNKKNYINPAQRADEMETNTEAATLPFGRAIPVWDSQPGKTEKRKEW